MHKSIKIGIIEGNRLAIDSPLPFSQRFRYTIPYRAGMSELPQWEPHFTFHASYRMCSMPIVPPPFHLEFRLTILEANLAHSLPPTLFFFFFLKSVICHYCIRKYDCPSTKCPAIRFSIFNFFFFVYFNVSHPDNSTLQHKRLCSKFLLRYFT